MALKLTCNTKNPPLAGLAAVELVKETSPVTIEWAQANVLTFTSNGKKLECNSDNEILRAVARSAPKYQLYGTQPIELSQIDHWLTFSLTLGNDVAATLNYLQKCLSPLTFLVANRLTIADLAVYAELYRNQEAVKKAGFPSHVQRWYSLIEGQPAVARALSSLSADAQKALLTRVTAAGATNRTAGSGIADRKQEGKFVELPGAEMGKVVVRFPPEASGYLHIGHAKAALLNQYYQQAFNGTLIMRFDDTNPAKETVEFEQVILGDLKLLQIKPDKFTHTSQYFDVMLEYCEKLMADGKAYVDDTEPEQMKKEREQRIESANRTNSLDKNMELWKEMVKGSAIGQKCCVRAKINMNSNNGCMRDPTIYRCKNEPHPRTGTQYKVYPTYDFACPIVDAIENVTHTLRTTEYIDRDEQFYWFIDALSLRKPYIWSYSRLNLKNTVLSKRRLTWFVDEGLVDGWDDPRFPTVRGILRRGMTVEGLREFIIAQGSSKSVVFMEWDKIWAINKKVIDPIAPRYTALEASNRIVVNVAGVKEAEPIQVAAHPKNPDVGQKTIWIGPRILIDYVDAEVLKEGENATFINWGNLLIKKINKDGQGRITSVDAELNLDNKDFKKTPKLTWLYEGKVDDFPPTYCVYFDHIISKGDLGKDEDFKQYVGKNTRIEIEMLGDPELKKCREGDIIQLQRRGFFRVDRAYAPASPFTGVASPVVLFEIPDGHQKAAPVVAATTPAATPSLAVASGSGLHEKITKQGNVVRDLKSAKAEKAKVEEAVKTLLALKTEFKTITGKDWTPGAAPAAPKPAAATNGNAASDLNDKITKQGNLVRDLKSQKAEKAKVEGAVKTLLALKTEFKTITGKDWTPGAAPPAPKPAAATNSNAASDLNDKITKQGNLVRDLKSQKAEKAKVEEAVKTLLALKTEFKAATGKDWAPGVIVVSAAASTAASGDESAQDLNEKIVKQGNIVRDLKAKKSDKATVDGAVKELLALKVDFKKVTGKDWSPGIVAAVPAAVASSSNKAVVELHEKITQQGSAVRDLKSKKADKANIDVAVKLLLSLKAEFKLATGKDWTPESAPPAAATPVTQTTSAKSATGVSDQITKQGNLVRELKTSKADKGKIDAAVKELLSLKAEYKSLTGSDWTPGNTAGTTVTKPEANTAATMADNGVKTALTDKVNAQANAVRTLKSNGSGKADIDAAVKLLLDLKLEYKNATGEEFPAPSGRAPSKKPAAKKPEKPAPAPSQSNISDGKDGGLKKQTRLGLEATKEGNLPEWYSQVLTKGELIEYYDVSGCYILRHWSFAIWKQIQKWFTNEIDKLGVKEVYFPLFVSKAALEKEKEHIADFSPEVAWVTKSGESELSEPVAIRPTSETVMYPAFAKWVQSYRDLPIRINQWSNVVRWEFKHPQPFLRTREFLWQEGHTAYANAEDAKEEVLTILDLYARVYTDLLAVPVIKGRKTTKEKFAGGDYTTTVEAYISASGRAIQGATSHHLGQNFSKMFDIVFDDPETREKRFAYQNSWGLTTRTIGVMIMVHGDNKGLVLPPSVASIQAVIVPCGLTVNTKQDERESLQASCKQLERDLLSASVRVEGDYRDNYSPGWKFNHWELKGVPIRIEVGPKDLAAQQVVAVRRDTGDKVTIPFKDITTRVPALLTEIQANLLAKATKDLYDNIKQTENFTDFCKALDSNALLLSPFCGEPDCEGRIKDESARDGSELEAGALAMGAKSLCIPFEQPAKKVGNKCIHPACKNPPLFWCLFGRSY